MVTAYIYTLSSFSLLLLLLSGVTIAVFIFLVGNASITPIFHSGAESNEVSKDFIPYKLSKDEFIEKVYLEGRSVL